MPARIIVVAGKKGGIGKSTIAANLAVCAARDGRDVLLVDTDDQETTQTWAAARSEVGDVAGITTVAITNGKQVRPELLRLAPKYDLVIVDAAGRDTTAQRAALATATVALLPFPPRGPDLWTLGQVATIIDEIRAGANPALRALAFVNKADPIGADNAQAEELFQEHKDSFEGLPIRVGNRKAIADTHLQGLGVAEMRGKRDAKAIQEIDALYRCVFGIITTPEQHQNSTEAVS